MMSKSISNIRQSPKESVGSYLISLYYVRRVTEKVTLRRLSPVVSG